MREFTIRLDSEALGRGLYRERAALVDSVELEVAKNVVSWRKRLELWRDIKNPIPITTLLSAGIELNYPFPMLVRGRTKLFMFDSSRIFYVDPVSYDVVEVDVRDINDTAKVVDIPVGDYWHLVDFGDFWYAFNGRASVLHHNRFRMRGAEDVAVVSTERFVNAGTEFKGRVIMGGFSDDFWSVWEQVFADKAYSLYDGIKWEMPIGEDFIFWSNIGSDLAWLFYKTLGMESLIEGIGYDQDNLFILDMFQRNDIGFMRIPYVGTIMRIVPLPPRFLVVYGDNGICVLAQYSEPAPTFGIVNTFEIGIPHAGCIASNSFEHLILGNDGALWLLDGNLKLQRIGYEEHFKYDLDLPTNISYDRFRSVYYIGNRKGTYVLGTDGLTWTSQIITGVVDNYGEVVSLGTHFVEDREVVVRTTEIELTRPGLKNITWVRVGTATPDKYSVSVLANYGDGWQVVKTVKVNGDGEALLNVSTKVAKIQVTADDYSEVSPIEYVDVSIQYVDKRYVRGPYVAASNS